LSRDSRWPDDADCVFWFLRRSLKNEQSVKI